MACIPTWATDFRADLPEIDVPMLVVTRRLQLTGTTALRRTKGWGAVLAALVSGLVLRSLRYTVTGSRSAVTAAV